MEKLLSFVRENLDTEFLNEHVLKLFRIARKQTFPAYHQEAQYACDLLKQEGFEAEMLHFPADGKTAYQDKCMPLGWDVSHMKLTLLTPVAGIDDPLISDFEREPLMAVKGSVSTPPGGIKAQLVTEAQMRAGFDVRGCFVLLNPMTRPLGAVMKMMADLGAIGWVSDFLENPDGTPDSVAWINAGTETNTWHVIAEDRDFIGYQITPRTGRRLRLACENGAVFVRAESDGHRYESTLPAVTAAIEGEDKREIWLLAHLYEPLVDDNSNGVIACVGVLKCLRELAKQKKLKYSVRVIFGAEMYGFAAVAEHFGGKLEDKTIGAINMDGIHGAKHLPMSLEMYEAPDYYSHRKPYGYPGNVILHAVTDAANTMFGWMNLENKSHRFLGDDCFLGDATVGLPTIWPSYPHSAARVHHNSCQDESAWDPERFAAHAMISTAWVCAMATLTAEEIKALLPGAVAHAKRILEDAAKVSVRCPEDAAAKMEYLLLREQNRIRGLHLWSDDSAIDEAADSLTVPALPGVLPAAKEKILPDYVNQPLNSWYDYSENFIFTRLTVGMPHDQVKIPYKSRFSMPGSIIYRTLADIASRMDGKKDFKTLLREAEWDIGQIHDEATIRSYLHTCLKLADAGYLSVTEKDELTADKLAAALRAVGVREGETLLVHAGLTNLGHLSADTAIEALRQAVGEDGTFLVPIFARPYIGFEGVVNTAMNFRPYDTRPDGALRDATINTGALSRAMAARADASRTGHPTHEWAALGKNAAELTAGQAFLDAPTGATSPLMKALEQHGSVVFLGCGLNSNTFLHLLETLNDVPYLNPAIFKYIDKTGEPRTAIIEKHLPGHRNFYDNLGNNDFYGEAVARGLKIHCAPLGNGKIYRISLEELYEVGQAMFRDDPLATLCKDPTCRFCSRYRK